MENQYETLFVLKEIKENYNSENKNSNLNNIQKKKKRTILAINLTPNKKSQKSVPSVYTGNIPVLVHGMKIDVIISRKNKSNIITDYKLTLDEANLKAIQDYNKRIIELNLDEPAIDISEYRKTLERYEIFRKYELSWEIAQCSTSELYKIFPFKIADVLHYELVNDATETERLKAISIKICKLGRKARKIEWSMNDYLRFFNIIESNGTYKSIPLYHKISCLSNQNIYEYKNGLIIDAEMKQKEAFTISDMKERMKNTSILLTTGEIQEFIDEMEFSAFPKCQEQLDVLLCLTSTSPCIITGGAGVGKTTVIKNLIKCFKRYYGNNETLLIAPTGRASRKLSEKTNYNASTIHKALRKNPNDEFVFYTSTNPMPYKIIICDEASMVDTSLMYDLLKACKKDSKIILVGDHNQLAPVAYGEPFFAYKDMLNVYTLNTNHRQAEGTDILCNALACLEGKPLFNGQGVTIQDIYYEEIENYLISDDNTQIITPYIKINDHINNKLKKGVKAFNVGDKIITLRNTDDYCNGDIGVILSINNYEITVEIEGKKIQISKEDINDINLAYAITVHKMQGSEAERVICFFPKKASEFISKQMIYTAITRAKKELIIYFYSE